MAYLCWIVFHPCWSHLCHHSENSERHWRLLKSTDVTFNAAQCQQQALGANKMLKYLEKKSGKNVPLKSVLKLFKTLYSTKSVMVTHCCLEDRPLFLIRFGVLSALCVKLPVHTLTPTANRLTEALKQGRELAVCMLDSIIFCLLFYLKYLEIHMNKHPQYFPEVTSTRSSHLSIKHLGVYLQHTATWW